jgi:hypothetical protein
MTDLEEEQKYIEDKILKMYATLENTEYIYEIGLLARNRLRLQYHIMRSYSFILAERIHVEEEKITEERTR